jgi:hypothetical protein
VNDRTVALKRNAAALRAIEDNVARLRGELRAGLERVEQLAACHEPESSWVPLPSVDGTDDGCLTCKHRMRVANGTCDDCGLPRWECSLINDFSLHRPVPDNVRARILRDIADEQQRAGHHRQADELRRVADRIEARA